MSTYVNRTSILRLKNTLDFVRFFFTTMHKLYTILWYCVLRWCVWETIQAPSIYLCKSIGFYAKRILHGFCYHMATPGFEGFFGRVMVDILLQQAILVEAVLSSALNWHRLQIYRLLNYFWFQNKSVPLST